VSYTNKTDRCYTRPCITLCVVFTLETSGGRFGNFRRACGQRTHVTIKCVCVCVCCVSHNFTFRSSYAGIIDCCCCCRCWSNNRVSRTAGARECLLHRRNVSFRLEVESPAWMSVSFFSLSLSPSRAPIRAEFGYSFASNDANSNS
jgi:hypothetical protein